MEYTGRKKGIKALNGINWPLKGPLNERRTHRTAVDDQDDHATRTDETKTTKTTQNDTNKSSSSRSTQQTQKAKPDEGAHNSWKQAK